MTASHVFPKGYQFDLRPVIIQMVKRLIYIQTDDLVEP